MQYSQCEEEKGLFTFYREQQAEEDEIRTAIRRKKKTKSKKKASKSEHCKGQGGPNQEHQGGSRHQATRLIEPIPEEKHSERFLRNVIGRYCKDLPSNQSVRLRTDPARPPQQKIQTLNLLKNQQKLEKGELNEFGRMRFREGKEGQQIEGERRSPFFLKYGEKANQKIVDLQDKIVESDIFDSSRRDRTGRTSIPVVEPIGLEAGAIIPRSCKNENSCFLDKLQFQDRKSRSNLIPNRESLGKNHDKLLLEVENKKYFHNLISNFYKHQHDNYTALKNGLKFPHISREERAIPQISREDRAVRVQTEEQAQSMPEKRILSRIKSFASNKRSLKFSSPSRYHEEACELGGNEGRVLNLIDLSKDYSRGHIMDSQDRKLKKKMIKSRLGIEF